MLSEAAAHGSANAWTWSWMPLSAYLELSAALVFVANLALTIILPPRDSRLHGVSSNATATTRVEC